MAHVSALGAVASAPFAQRHNGTRSGIAQEGHQQDGSNQEPADANHQEEELIPAEMDDMEEHDEETEHDSSEGDAIHQHHEDEQAPWTPSHQS